MGKGTVYVIKNGQTQIAESGNQPKNALLFAASGKSLAQMIIEQTEQFKENAELVRSRLAAASKWD
ncbi:hypothetical protein [Paenibacillus contaminans]|uniref:Uncharacterized protein n=1 Tax=Paenibacillus contaminans TaxID=450362 RepID=A0A329LZS1_9BACL|nr:hypothetical protein [Paenibacillus contaminans]RAV12968.1 hypothetical protein DQG23_33850 [Paenibacillus contaminans]